MTSLRFPVDDAHVQSSVPLPVQQDVLYCRRDVWNGHVVVLMPMSRSTQPTIEHHQSSARAQQNGVDLTASTAWTGTSSSSRCVPQDLTTHQTRCSDSDLSTNMSGRCQGLPLTGNRTPQQDVTDLSVVKSSASAADLTTRNPVFGNHKSPKSYWLRRHSDSVFATRQSAPDDVPTTSASDSSPQLCRTSSDSRSTFDDLDAVVAGPTIYEAHQLARLPDRLLSTVVGVHYSADSDEVFDVPAVESPDDLALTTSRHQPTRPARSRLTVVSTGDLEDIREEEFGVVDRQDSRHVGVDVADSSTSVKTELSEQLVPSVVDVNSAKSTVDRQWQCAAADVTCPRDADARMLVNGSGHVVCRPETACSPSATIHRRAASRVVRSARSSTSDEPTTSGSVATSGVCRVHRCTVCRRTFSRSDMLERHARLHSGLRPYACRLCPQVFSRSDHLTTHLRTHTGEKPYSCPRCAYTASRRDMVTRHLRVHQSTTAGADVVGPTPTRQRIYRNRYKDRPTKPLVVRRPSVDVVARPSTPPPQLPPLMLSDRTRYLQCVDQRRIPTTVAGPGPLSPPLSPAAVDPATVGPRLHQPVHVALPPRPVVARGSTGSTDSYSSPGCLSACDIFEFALNSVGSVDGSPDVFRSPLSGRQSTVFLFPYTDASSPPDHQTTSAV